MKGDLMRSWRVLASLTSLAGVVAIGLMLAGSCGPQAPQAAEPAPAKEKEGRVKPIRALLVTGGCCHDYDMQKLIITEGVSARAHVEWSIVQQGGSTTNTRIPLYENADWARGYDIVVHNECFSEVKDPRWTERILRPHRDGLPAVVIHCAMHCYRDGSGEWFKFVGVTSHGHGGHFPFEVRNVARDHPIMAGFGESWKTPAGELYQIAKLGEHCKPLGQAANKETKKTDVCIWTNQYGKGRVFGTTIGHYNAEMADPVYLNTLTRGLLWACGKLEDRYLKPFDPSQHHFRWEEQARPPRQTKEPPLGPVPENLALGKKATASSSQSGDHNPAAGNDGDPDTRWCASGPQAGEWWQVDLGKPEEVRGCRILWEQDGRSYRYKVEGSADGKKWSLLVDQSAGSLRHQEQEHKFSASGIRHVRLSILGQEGGSWASFFEFEVHGTKQVKPARRSAGKSQAGLLREVKAPPEFVVSVFAAPPEVAYPTCVAATADGTVFVGIDENGSLGQKANRGRVLRCRDTDGDGKADQVQVFATMDSPRGLWFDHNTLYVLHPPLLEAFHDDDGDGRADRQEVLVSGLGMELKRRGADHTTNGFRMGIDGWMYIAMGDYGANPARGKDKTVTVHGGGVLRVRPDGSGLEVVSDGQRNIYDVAVSPQLDLFTRDNTNDGGGWDVRLSHVVPTGHYGYPTRFLHFADEVLAPLADYGGGAPCGSLYVDEPTLPAPYGDALYTCDWGRSMVYRHPLTPRGASWKADQKDFLAAPRPTDIDVDGSGRLYVSGWRNGGFDYSGPNVGYVLCLTPQDLLRGRRVEVQKASQAELLEELASASAVRRLAAQREILQRGERRGLPQELENMAGFHRSPAVRVAALFTLAQLQKAGAREALLRLARLPAVRAYALRALTDDRAACPLLPTQPFVDALHDSDARTRAQAAIGLGRMGKQEAAGPLLLAAADQDPIVAHVAINALVALRAHRECLAALDSPGSAKLVPAALRVLQELHEPEVVDGLLARLPRASTDLRAGLLKALARLYQREAPWDGQWWGTRPDTRGPYYQPVKWPGSERIGKALQQAIAQADARELPGLLEMLHRNRVDLPEINQKLLALAGQGPEQRRLAAGILADEPNLSRQAIAVLGTVGGDFHEDAGLRARALRAMLRHLGDRSAHAALMAAFTSQSRLPGPVEEVWKEFVHEGRQLDYRAELARLAADTSVPARQELACCILTVLAGQNVGRPEDRAEVAKSVARGWEQPQTAVALLHAVVRLGIDRYAAQVRRLVRSESPAVARAAREAAVALRVDLGATKDEPRIAKLSLEEVLKRLPYEKGMVERGAKLFTEKGCITCHTVSAGEPPRGPFLGGIATRYSQAELAESILRPSARIAQGFETHIFSLQSGKVITGFVVRESADEVEVRDATGAALTIRKNDIDERSQSKTSVMPERLVDDLTPGDLASLLAYLASLRSK